MADLDVRTRFAANLRRLRSAAGVSQEALALRCGLHRTEVSLLERSERSPTLETIVLLMRGLGLESCEQLLHGIS
jgi:transcriptional regulator with XRE-family HTH domain